MNSDGRHGAAIVSLDGASLLALDLPEDLADKEAVLASTAPGFFTIPRFDGYAAVLIQLRTVGKRALREALLDGWLACAPTRLTKDHLAGG